MANSRAKDQRVDAFSAPKALLAAAKMAAIKLRMTKSGFYRYALAHELGYSESEALAVAEHLGVGNAVEAMREEYKSESPATDAGPAPARQPVSYRRRKSSKQRARLKRSTANE
jgi:hypothetical protein